ncbi:hypothetical protein HAP94_04425, partial [Acidithiobacillus ferrivorans]|nr:hypothetical protein [Acidithiobacillus ferrivorans]
ALVSAGLADENDLNRRGVAAVLTSDRLLEIRRAQTPENLKGAAVQPGYEKAAAQPDREPVQEPAQAKAQDLAQEQDQKRILVRNEDQQSQEKK